MCVRFYPSTPTTAVSIVLTKKYGAKFHQNPFNICGLQFAENCAIILRYQVHLLESSPGCTHHVQMLAIQEADIKYMWRDNPFVQIATVRM